MAKKATKNGNLQLDEWDFGSEFDMEEFNFEPKPVKDGRDAITRVAKGAWEGVKDTVKSPSFFREMIKKALPRGYGDMLDLADQSASTIRELYNEGAKESKPALREVARVVDKMLPPGTKYVPKEADKLIRKFVEANREPAQVGPSALGINATDMAVAGIMTDTFRYNTKDGARREAKEDVREAIKGVIDKNRHADSIGQLDSIRRSVHSMAAYQRRIEFNFQKKSLELQARHYFVSVDILNEHKRQNLRTTEFLQGILRNTSLPDSVKLKASERFKDMLRNKAMGSLQDGIFGQRNNFMQNIGKAFREQVMGSVKGFAEGVSSGAQGLETAADATRQMEEMGVDRYHLMGNMVGSQGANMLGAAAGSRLGRRLGGSNGKFGKAVKKFGNRLQFGAENAPQIMTDFSNSARDGSDYINGVLPDRLSDNAKRNISGVGGAILNPIIDLLRGTTRRANNMDTQVKSHGLGNIHDPAMFNNQAHRSLTEVIPGYLARIYRELQITRTGDLSIDLPQYDFSKGKFSDTKTVRKNTFNKLFDQSSRDGVQREKDQLLEMIDPQKKLSKAQRAELSKILMNDNLRGRAGYETGRVSNYTNSSSFAGSRNGAKYAKLFQGLNAQNEASGGETNINFAAKFSAVGRSASERRGDIQNLLEIYPRETLEDMGILKPGSEEVDMAKVNEYFGGAQYNAKGDLARGGLRAGGGPGPASGPPSTTGGNADTVKAINRLIATIERQNAKPLLLDIKNTLAGSRLLQGPATPVPPPAQVTGDHPNKKPLEEIKEVLVAIRERLNDGLITMNMPEGGWPPGFPPNGPQRRGLGDRMNLRLTDMAKGIFNLGRRTARFGAQLGNTLVGGGLRTAWKLGKGIAGVAGDVATFGVTSQYRRMRGFVDIYVGEERKPRMYGRIMQEGNTYFDKETGVPIRRLRDITGAVVKRTESGEEVVLEADEVEAAWQRMGPVKKTLRAMGVVIKTASKLGKGAFRALTRGIPPVFKMAAWGVKKVWGLLDMAQDIYVKDKLDSPAMTARIMRAGGYHSAVSGKIISRPSQIDGPVLSGEEVVLTHDDIRKGLVDKNNKPIKTGLLKLLSGSFGAARLAFKTAMGAGRLVNKAARSAVANGLKLGGKLLRGGLAVSGGTLDLLRGRNPFRSGSGDSAEQTLQVTSESNTYLKEIRDVLRERLPKSKKRSALDANDDGIRDGSYEDQMRNRTAAQQQAQNQNGPSGAPRGGVGGGLLGGAKSLWNKLRGKGDGEEGDTDIDINGGGRDERRARRLARRPGGSWATSRGWKGKAGFIARKGWGAIKGVSKFGVGLLGLGGLGLGAMASGIGGAIATGASAIGSGLLAAGGALASLISAPVVLGAAAVAALAVGGYYGYKYLTRKKLGLLSRVRYTQYGFLPTDTDHVGAVFGLEDKLREALIYGKEGAKLDGKRIDAKALVKDFDIDSDNSDEMENWMAWFSGRFKPVFLTHASALKATAGDKWLEDVDGLDADVALKYLNLVRFPEGPYNATVSPFKDLKFVPARKGDVLAVVQIAADELTKKAKSGVAAGVGGVVAVAASKLPADASVQQMNDSMGGKGAVVLNKRILQEATTSRLGSIALSGGQIAVSGSSTVLQSLGVDRLDGLDVVRLKTYGLVKMEAGKVKALMSLEKSVSDNLTFNKDVASWNGSLEQILASNGASFGVDITNEALATNWLNWFNQRFLPTFLNYATLVKAQTGKDTPAEGKSLLKSSQIVDVATGVFTTSGRAGSVWNVGVSPWDGYTMNGDVRSTDANLQGLKEVAKAVILLEPGSKAANQPTANKSAANTSAPVAPPSIFQKAGSAIGGAWEATKNFLKNGPSSGGPPVGGNPAVGNPMNHPGKGTGGDINAIPKPTGNKSWAALKDTIMAAAKMVGVDGKLMAAMAAVESGFDYTVKAGKSSATGLFQFIKGTWDAMLKRHGPKYGIDPNTPATDPRANALMGAEYLKESVNTLDGKIGRPLTDTDIYMAHFLGPGGAKKFLTADQNGIASTMMPDAAASNPSIFYDKNRSPRSFAQIYQLMNDRMRNKATGFGINDGGEAMVSAPATAIPTAPTSAAKVSPNSLGVTATVPPPVASTTTTASLGPTNNGIPIGVNGGGFTGPRPLADQMNAAKLQSEVRVSNLSDTNQILNDSLVVQKDTLLVLKGMSDFMSGFAKTASVTPPEATPSSQTTRAAPRGTSSLPQAPVSVAKPRFGT